MQAKIHFKKDKNYRPDITIIVARYAPTDYSALYTP